jgi:hypothetical protein
MVIRGIEAAAKGKDSFKSNKKTTLNGMFAMPEEIRRDHERAFAVQLGLYQKYVRGIEAVARDNGVKTGYFLQPSPSWGKVLTDEEKRVVGDLSYRDLYRKIVAGMMTLRAGNLPIFDLGDVFADEKGTIYADHIHFGRDAASESRGNRLIATRIGQLLAETWGLQRKP